MKFIAFLLIALAGSVFAVEPGLYHDPEQPGHGVAIYSAPEDHRVLTWFTYGPLDLVRDENGEPVIGEDGLPTIVDPSQAWLISDNFLPGDEVSLFRGSGYFPAMDFALGDPVGSAKVTEQGDSIRLEFAILDWPEGCDGRVPTVPACSGVMILSLLAAQ